MATVLTMQDVLLRLTEYWAGQGCLIGQPMNTEVGAGTLNPATALRVLGPEPWRVAYVEPSVRPDDSRYGDNPNRLQTHTQFQVILKPEPGDPQELYLGSLRAIGIDLVAHDVRFVEDNWASPALGAWGLGWEVWLDGLEITQFTYFQQSGGLPLDPVSVEITYGVERIVMALQGVTHFRDIAYAPGISYGEAFGQAEYEMSRYYLDDADIEANRRLLDIYEAEAHRLIEARLPVPAHTYVLKCSHAFNVLDARGAIGTTERARAFARMRTLAHQVAELWTARRAELGHPLGTTPNPPPVTPHTSSTVPVTASSAGPGTTPAAPPPRPQAASGVSPLVPGTKPDVSSVVPEGESGASSVGSGVGEAVVGGGGGMLAFEIGVEELPPGEAGRAGEAVRGMVGERLAATRLGCGEIEVYASPRRIILIIHDVRPQETDAEETVKGPRLAAAFDAEGQPTKAAEGFARGQGIAVEQLVTLGDRVGFVKHVPGQGAAQVLAEILPGVVTGLRAEKNMRWSAPGLTYSRPIRWLLALLGDQIVPFSVHGLVSGRSTRVHRTAEEPVIQVEAAEEFLGALRANGIEPDAALRKQRVLAGAHGLAREADGVIDVVGNRAVVEEVANLVEQPVPILGSFDRRYLELPPAVLVTVMKKHQRYLPVQDREGALEPYFVAVANGSCDRDAVRAGNEAVLRARYEDASFFFAQDLRTPLDEMRRGLAKLTFEESLGSMADRSSRIHAIAMELRSLSYLTEDELPVLERAGELAKFDLASSMVIELSSLAGTMAWEYARRAGEPVAVAKALLEMEQPRSAGDALPRSLPGTLLALADRLDLLAGLFGVGAAPTGSSDPYGMRRAALGVVAILRAHPGVAAITVRDGLSIAAGHQPVPSTGEPLEAAVDFVTRRFEQALLDEGHPVHVVRAVLPHAGRPAHAERMAGDLAKLLQDERFQRLSTALQRVLRIVPAGTAPTYSPQLFEEESEHLLNQVFLQVKESLALAPDTLPSFTEAALPLAQAIDAYFDQVMVMADDPAQRANRLGFLAALRDTITPIIDWREIT